MSYAFAERYVLPLSHDEVVHGKGSLIRKMPGDDWQKFANARVACAYHFAHPGKKLHFMGLEFAQWDEWKVKGGLDWHLVTPGSLHAGLQNLVRDLNRLYREEPALRELDLSHEGFQWIDFHDRDQNVFCFARRGHAPESTLVCVFNFSPVPRTDYRVGVPRYGHYAEVLNTDAAVYGGGNMGNLGGVKAEEVPAHNFGDSVRLTLPPLGAVWLKLN
jgi:1,4-alpha-glucan branching enzyme